MGEYTERFSAFWRNNAVTWEDKRYDGILSGWLYTSLKYRLKYLAFIVDGLPANSKVVELGCGSGRLFGEITNKKNLKYVGYDISAAAIDAAKRKWHNYPNAEWICASIGDVPTQSCDLVVSAGLLDWLNDDQIKRISETINGKYFAHSFSKKEKSLKTLLHRVFSLYQSQFGKNPYSPRKYSFNEMESFFKKNSKLSFSSHRDLSFGSVVHNLNQADFGYRRFKISEYFKFKKKSPGFFERLVKAAETSAVMRHSGLIKGANVLEIGSGTGHYSKLITEADPGSFTCVDPYVKTGEFLSPFSAVKFVNAAFETARIEGRFDLIFLLGVLEFAENQAELIQKTKNVSARGARVIVLYPRKNSFAAAVYRIFHKRNGGVDFASPDELQKSFIQNGFHLRERSAAGALNDIYVFEVQDE